jgi:asparagine synthase (glutamine-hydrolysing)
MLALYDRRGVDFVNDLRGMFAFALWDARRQRLVLGRDRLGKKPLYYYVNDHALVFASEPKGIFVDPEVEAAADPVAIHHYLTFGYIPSPRSAFRGVHKLPPAHMLISEQGRVRTEKYWELRYGPKLAIGEDEAAERLIDTLREAVRLRLRLEHSRGADGGSLVAPGEDLLDRLRGSGVQRAALRAGRRAALGHRSPRVRGEAERDRGAA